MYLDLLQQQKIGISFQLFFSSSAAAITWCCKEKKNRSGVEKEKEEGKTDSFLKYKSEILSVFLF